MAVVSAHDVIAELRKRLPGLSQKAAHKLLYYCQGHHLATFDRPMFGETISAYDMGPVVGPVWHREQQEGPVPQERSLSEAELNTVGYVVSRYGSLTPKDLENLTHSETPWRRADDERKARKMRRATITHESLIEYFRDESAADPDDDLLVDVTELAEWLSGASEPTGPAKDDSLDRLRLRLEARA